MAGEEEAAELLSAFVQSCKDVYGAERCKIIHDQGDYLWIVQLKFTDEISAQFSIPRASSELMDVFLKGKSVSQDQRVSFNRAVASNRCPSDIGTCLESAEKGWEAQENEISPASNPMKKEKRKPKPKKPAEVSVEDENSGFHGMKPAQDVISRILWDDSLPSENFVVGYLDRFLGIMDKPFTAFNWDHFSAVDPEATAIPRHRIQYFKYGSVIVWDRRNRSDLIFGTGAVQHGKTLEAIIREENEKIGFVIQDSNQCFEESEDSDFDDFLTQDGSYLREESREVPIDPSLDEDFAGFSDVPAGVHPNYYLSIPIRSEGLLTQIRRAQDSIKDQFPRAVRKRMNPETLHITLCLFVLEKDGATSPESIAKAISASAEEIKEILEETAITVRGLALFRGSRVIFAKPDKGCIKGLIRKLAGIFTENRITFFVPENIHLTIYRLHPLRREEEWTALEEAVAVSKLASKEIGPTLSLKPMSEAKIRSIKTTGGVPEFLPEFAGFSPQSQTKGKHEEKILDEKSTPLDNSSIDDTSKKHVGCHVRDAWEFDSMMDVVYKASAVGGTAMAFFFQYPREFNGKCAKLPENVKEFHEACQKSGVSLENIVPHGSYWLNPGSTDRVHLERTRERMVEDVKKCQALGIKLYNFHPGVLTGDRSVEKFLENVVGTLNHVLKETQGSNVTLLLETAAGQGNEIGGRFEEIRRIMDSVTTDTDRVGVCVDTCHIFAAGYDIRTRDAYEETMKNFEEIIGFRNLKAVHLNDSKVPLGARQDRHEIIGRGQIGLNAFRYIMKDPRFEGIPMVLETPKQRDDHLSEIQLLRSFEKSEDKGEVAVLEVMSEYVPKTFVRSLMSTYPERMREFEEEIRAYHDENILDEATFSAKNEMRRKLELLLKGELGESVCLVPIGGIINGLGTRFSDMDLSLILPAAVYGLNTSWQYAVNTLRRGQKALRTDFVKSCVLRTGVIPILRLEVFDGDSAVLEVDINCNDSASVYDSHLLRYYAKFDWKFPAIALIVKKWAGNCGINDARIGYLNNYTFVLMVLHYLQAGLPKPVLPNLQTVFSEIFNGGIEVPNLDYDDVSILEGLESENESSVAELSAGFFGYFSNFPFHEEWISIKEGKPKLREELSGDSEGFFVYIEDPFEEKNTARCVLETEKMERIVKCFRAACGALKGGPCLDNLGIL